MKTFSIRKVLVYAQLLSTAVLAHSVRRTEPKLLHTVQDVTFTPTLSQDAAPSQLAVSFTPSGSTRRVTLSLHRDEDIYTQPVTVHRIRADGSVRSSETTPAGDHLVYRGTASTHGHAGREEEEWARVSVHVSHGLPLLEGAYFVDGFEYHIQTDATYRRTRSEHDAAPAVAHRPYNVVWRYVDDHIGSLVQQRAAEQPTCGLDSLEGNNSLERRQRGGSGDTTDSLVQTIGSTSGCPSTRAIALLGIATDCSYTAQFSSDQEIRRNILTQVSTASRVYESAFNVQLRVRNITISDAACPSGSSGLSWNRACAASLSIGDRLNEFSRWKAGFDDRAAAWTLLTACPSGSTVGIAWIRSVCQPGVLVRGAVRSTPSTNVVARTAAEWQVLAHELGHNFGAVHDCTSACAGGAEGLCCPLSSSSNCDARGQYMMNPSVSSRVTEFSPCSIGQVCAAWGGGNINTACLSGNDDVPTVSESVCGNGVVDAGEDCDCGGPEGCGDNACCNPTTCRFTAGAVCDPSRQRCCTAQCGLAASGQVCRESIGLCDPEETCGGSTADCPRDEQLPDGQACGDGGQGLTCATGMCTSRALQCSKLLTSNNSTSTVSAGGGNVTAEACSATGCELNCLQTLVDGGTCQASAKFFRDGTPCGDGARRCSSGTCVGQAADGSNGGGDAAAWIRNNRTLFIVLCVVGGVAVLAVLAWMLCCCCRSSSRGRAVGAQQTRMATAMRQSGAGGGVVPQQQVWPQPPPMRHTQMQTPVPVTRTGSNLHRYA
ncbi:ADAM 8 precursor [Cordyceps militaris CM01]|uniref:Disintegrin and metalloproteinase domain-containing protein B n=1 Tax=Cordyceps militaris (strain CM01) TaxID=983644 RepID=G3JCN1_CORMM|nr:ADAM 8 precursor [Cordyceps militaris CM01]EGX93843.1 ADAM 8 precursor [Cordyceps militaris CM01]